MNQSIATTISLPEAIQTAVCLASSVLVVDYFVKLGSFSLEAMVFLGLYAALKKVSSLALRKS